jgi:hypothetical protein
MAYASEEDMLRWVLERNNRYKMKDSIEEVPVDTLTTFSLEDEKPKLKKLKGKHVAKKTTEEMRKIYCETFSATELAPDLLGNNEQVGTVIDITPTVYRAPAVNSWPHGQKTGQVRALPAPKKPTPEGRQHQKVQHLHDLSEGSVVTVELSDYDSLAGNTSPKTFLVKLVHEGYPDIEFNAYLVGEEKVDELIAAQFGAVAKVASILKSNLSPAVVPHKIYLHDVKPIPAEAAA